VRRSWRDGAATKACRQEHKENELALMRADLWFFAVQQAADIGVVHDDDGL
jgi:hypothetical protein